MGNQSFESDDQGKLAQGDVNSGENRNTSKDEHPTGEFDNTTLEEFGLGNLTAPTDLRTLPENMPSVAETVAPPIEHQYPRSQSFDSTPRNKRKLFAFIAGGLTLVGAGIGAGMALGEDNKNETVAVEDTETKDATPTTTITEDSVISPEVTPTLAPTPETTNRFETGNIYLGNILPGEETFTTTTERGEEIQLPYLRIDGSPNEFAESALALLSCYLTTGDDVCLDELTRNSIIREGIMQWRETDYIADDHVQAVFYDRPNRPAEFSREVDADGYTVLRLTDGDLYYEAHYGDDDWQSDKATGESDYSQQIASELALYFEQTSDGMHLVRYDFTRQ